MKRVKHYHGIGFVPLLRGEDGGVARGGGELEVIVGLGQLGRVAFLLSGHCDWLTG